MAVAASVIPIKAKNIFKFRRGVFAGEPVEPYRKAILDAYGFEPNIGLWRHRVFHSVWWANAPPKMGCTSRWTIACRRSSPRASSRRKNRKLLAMYPRRFRSGSLARPHGRVGAHQLLRCSASDPLPDLGPGPGRQHRALRLWPHSSPHPGSPPQRRYSELGSYPFFHLRIEEKDGCKLAQRGQVAKWQLRITRQCTPNPRRGVGAAGGRFGRGTLSEGDQGQGRRTAGVHQAWERGLIAEPEVRLVEQVVEERTGTGKVKMAIYEKEYFG